MPGFLVSNVNKSFKLNNLYNEKCVYENLECAFKVCRNTLNKFLDDKILQENERYIIVTDGVLLNKKTLMEQYQCDSLFALIITMYQQHGIKFPDYFRGGYQELCMTRLRINGISGRGTSGTMHYSIIAVRISSS